MRKELVQAKYSLAGYLKANSALLWELPLLSVILSTQAALKDHKNPKNVFFNTGVAIISLISVARGIEQTNQIEKRKKANRELLARVNASSEFKKLFFT